MTWQTQPQLAGEGQPLLLGEFGPGGLGPRICGAAEHSWILRIGEYLCRVVEERLEALELRVRGLNLGAVTW